MDWDHENFGLIRDPLIYILLCGRIKDHTTVMQGRFAILPSNSDSYCVPNIIKSYYVSLNSQRKMLNHNTNHIIRDRRIFYLGRLENEKLLFDLLFF